MPEGPPAAGGGPAFADWEAPPQWRAIDFVSDLHLSPALPRTLQAFTDYLESGGADAVAILGDLFEVWVGDDAAEGGFESALAATLAAAARRRALFFMAGNRDFLFGDALLGRCGITALPDPTRLVAFGRPVVLSHGDALCLDDTEYQAFRTQVRAPAWRAAFLARPLAERSAIAAEIRRRSEMRRQFDGRPDADLDETATRAWLAAAGAGSMIHGHTHRPADHRLEPAGERHVLTDWDLDDAARPRAGVLRLTARGIRRLTLAEACTR